MLSLQRKRENFETFSGAEGVGEDVRVVGGGAPFFLLRIFCEDWLRHLFNWCFMRFEKKCKF